jgi:hypothetical protein
MANISRPSNDLGGGLLGPILSLPEATVLHLDEPPGAVRDLLVVRHQQDRLTLSVKPAKELEHLEAAL